MSWSTSELRVRLAPWNQFKPSSKIFYWLFQGGTSFVDLLCFCSVLCLLCLCARLFICALWSPAGKGLTSWLSFVVSYCEFVTFPLVSWVRCGTWLYRFLIFAPLLTGVLLVFRTTFYCMNCLFRKFLTSVMDPMLLRRTVSTSIFYNFYYILYIECYMLLCLFLHNPCFHD